jgi:hypothetical protein
VLWGNRGKALPILTLVPVSFVLLSQAVMSWLERGEAAPGHRSAAAVITLLFVISIGMLMRVAYADSMPDGQPVGPTSDPGGRSASQKNPFKGG